MTTTLFDRRNCRIDDDSTSNNEDKKDQYKKLFTIQYTKKELDKITLDFVTQMNNYIARVNDRILKTIEEIEKEEVEIVRPTITMIESE